MKVMLSVVVCALGCWLMAGCGGSGGGGGNTPGDVVKRYSRALCNGDTKTTLECIDPAKHKDFGKLIGMGAQIASAFAESEGGLDSVTIVREQIDDDRAFIKYMVKTKKGGERADTVNTEKINGTWYIAP